MKYIQLIEQAKTHGVTSEKKMWNAMEKMSCDLSLLEEEKPALYWRIMRNQHAVLLQHITQLNLLLVAAPRTDDTSRPRRTIGFRPEEH